MTITYRLVSPQDVPRAFELESSSYPQDEAATLESLQYRQSNASNLFLGAYNEEDTLIGYICSTRTDSPTLTHDSMSLHVPNGSYIAIHSVCVDSKYRRKGIASGLLKEYIERMKREEGIKGMRLISKERLIKMYESNGFHLVGKSQVVHGQDTWFELKIDFSSEETDASSSSPLIEIESDEQDRMNLRSPAKRISSDRNAIQQLLTTTEGDKMNGADLYCPRAECRCLLVKKGTAKWVKGHQQDIELPPLPTRLQSSSSSSSTPSTTTHRQHRGYWTLSSPLAFENIGFTRSTASTLPSSTSTTNTSNSKAPPSPQKEIKYLTCADCDFGPLGWHDTEGRDLGLEVEQENNNQGGQGGGGGGGEVRKGREFLLDVERVRYKI